MINSENIKYKKHAAEMMVERGITKLQVKTALEQGSKFKQTEGFLAVHTYFSVAYMMEQGKYIIKTVYLQ